MLARFILAVLLLSSLPSFCRGQDHRSESPQPLRTISPAQPPFDRLELLGLVDGTFSAQYVINEIGKRGLSFIPDDEFLKTVARLNRGPGIPEAIELKESSAIKEPPSPQHDAAYHILLHAIGQPGKGDHTSADQEFQDALKLAPDSATLHLAFATHLMLHQKYAEAEQQLRRSLELWPEDADAHVELATSLIAESRPGDAVDQAKAALQAFPKHKAAVVALAMALTRNRQYSDAVPVLREAISRTPEMPGLYEDLGVSLFHLGDVDDAVRQFKFFLGRNPDNAEAHYYLGAALRAKGQLEEAQAEFKEAARLSPDNPLYQTVLDPSQEVPNSNQPIPDSGIVSGNVYTNKFFRFSYEFPRGWRVLSADTAKGLAQYGGEILANGDPTLQDAQRAASKNAYPLFFAQEGLTKNGAIGLGSIQIKAVNSHIVPSSSAAAILTDSASFLKQVSSAIEPVGELQELEAGGRAFQRLNLHVRVGTSTMSAAQVAVIEKGYLLMFVFNAADNSELDELVRSMQSLHFADTADIPEPAKPDLH